MSIKIDFVKVILPYGDKKGLKILHIEVLEQNDLPDEYIISGECVYKRGYILFYNDGQGGLDEQILVEGQMYTAEDFYGRILPIIKRCGKRLYQINREKRNEWKGVGGVII